MGNLKPPLSIPLVELSNLSFRHPGRQQPTLVDVNLTLNGGEIVLLAGATGSGKSTVLNCLAGIAPHYSGGTLTGQVLYQGTDVREWSVRQRAHDFCVLLQNVETQIFTDQVWEEIIFGLENWNLPIDQIPLLADSALQEFGLIEQRKWLIQRLSAGQKQRLLLACLLTIGQPVLLLDEPLAYLDAKGVSYLLQLLRSRADQGQAILMVEHRLDLVAEICDRAYCFQESKLLERSLARSGGEGVWDGSASVFSQAFQLKSSLPTPQPEQNREILLQTQQLSLAPYPPFPDLTVYAGETVLLQGDNGCGKTTLLKVISGLLKPTTGRLEIMGREMSRSRVLDIARTVGFVLQNPNHQLFADSVRQEILQPGVAPEWVDELLEQLDLKHWADQHPQSLSQGQKRRLALGSVLARQPRICLLDEIVVGQDPNSLGLMLQVLQNFIRQGNALILTSHVPLAAEALNARVVPITAFTSLVVDGMISDKHST